MAGVAARTEPRLWTGTLTIQVHDAWSGEKAMTETCGNPDEPSPVELIAEQGDPMALSGVEAAMFGLANYCPVTLLGTKALETICGDDRSDHISSTERIFRANVRLGYGITLAGLCCPIFWLSYFAGVTGVETDVARGRIGNHRYRWSAPRGMVPGPARLVPPERGHAGRVIAFCSIGIRSTGGAGPSQTDRVAFTQTISRRSGRYRR